jgi:hypothetical protein
MAAVLSACDRGHPARRLFRFVSASVPTQLCLRHAVAYRRVSLTALKTCVVVGTILTAINQGNVLLAGHFPPILWWKIPLTYCVPYSVATFAALRVSLVREQP